MRPEVISHKSEAKAEMQDARCKMQDRKDVVFSDFLPLASCIFFSCLLLTVLSGCVVITSEDDPIKKDMNGLRQDIAVQQRKLVSLEEAVKKEAAGREQESRSQKSEVGRIDEYVQKGKADVNASIDRIKEDMAFLSGRFEEAEAEVKKIKNDIGLLQAKAADSKETKEMNSRLASAQERLTALEKRLAGTDERLAAMEQAIDRFNKGQASAADEAKKDANKKEVKPPKPDELYNEAIKLTKDKDYSNAVEKFAGFISLFPDHELASNAQYWIGEIHYAQKDYERAVLEFNDVVQKYPKSKKVSAALLKQGMAFSELGNKKEARLVLEKVMDKYPKTEEASMAQKMLKGMK
ncbi:MAG: tol-pal system protein YbgF [Deltaproteobacteria bacterium]|nr:tol-pal system protein YbgF [Deltaproteobacteria bacterium]